MRYQEIKPSAAAGRFVRCYWMLEDPAPGSGGQRIVPDGRAELILNLGQPYESRADGAWNPQPRCFLFGQITGPLVVRSAGPVRMIGIRFHPHTAGQLLKIPMCELTDTAVSVDDISGRSFRELRQLGEPRSLLKRIAALDRIVLALGKRAGGDDALLSAAVKELETAGGSIGVGGSVGVVADHTGLSARQFERRFRQAVGISPKLFSRMQRFQRVFPALESADIGWADTAVRCGYYDQARACRIFPRQACTLLAKLRRSREGKSYEKFRDVERRFACFISGGSRPCPASPASANAAGRGCRPGTRRAGCAQDRRSDSVRQFSAG